MISYSPLWKVMNQKNISQYHLIQNGIDRRTIHTLKNNGNITLYTLEKLCNIIDCTPNDIVIFETEISNDEISKNKQFQGTI